MFGLEGYMENSDPQPEPIIVIAHDIDDKAGTARMIAEPENTLKHAFDYIGMMDLTHEAKRMALWQAALAIITIVLGKDIIGRT
jgi:hypothetical protein